MWKSSIFNESLFKFLFEIYKSEFIRIVSFILHTCFSEYKFIKMFLKAVSGKAFLNFSVFGERVIRLLGKYLLRLLSTMLGSENTALI